MLGLRAVVAAKEAKNRPGMGSINCCIGNAADIDSNERILYFQSWIWGRLKTRLA
jgi:hypothetical protein